MTVVGIEEMYQPQYGVDGSRTAVLDVKRCVRRGNKSAVCQACVDICPHGCIALDGADPLTPLLFDWNRCDDCGLCVGACMNGAFTSLSCDQVQLKRHMDSLAQHYDRLYLTCRRTEGSKLSGAIVEVPALGALPWEFYFACLANYEGMAIYLPLGTCEECEIAGCCEEWMMNAIARAEEKSGLSMGLIADKEELDFAVADFEEDLGRRALVTGITDFLADASRRNNSRQATLGLGNREELARRTREAHLAAVREREERFAEAHETGRFRREPKTATPARHVLFDALREYPELQEGFTFTSVRTSGDCTLCRTCLLACPLSARLVRDMRVTTDDLYCTACGKCVQLCPEQAIYPVEVDAETLDIPDYL